MVLSTDLIYMIAGVAAIVGFIVALMILFLLKVLSKPLPYIWQYDCEKTFINPESGQTESFPVLEDDSTLTLSVVVPSYNEEERLPIMLDEALDYLENRSKKDSNFSYEVIIVDDGSHDKTTKVGLTYVEKYGSNKVRVLTFKKNRGKGGAVRMGVFSTRGAKVLFVDADGATKFSDLDKVEQELVSLRNPKNGMALSVGSRAHLQEESIAQRSAFRNFLMHGFHFLVYVLCVKGIKDTQCGFKLMTREAALRLFSCLHVERWAFDVELLYIAQSYGVPIAEVAVNWQEIDGSKMVPIFSWMQMGKDLILIRLRYLIGAWKMSLDKPVIHHLK